MIRRQLGLALLFAAFAGNGATVVWKSTSGGVYSQSGNWYGGVPGNSDTALFTNAENYSVQWNSAAIAANAYFRGTGTVTQEIQSASWTIRTNYSIGDVANAAATVVLRSGTLNVSNQGHTAQMRIGGPGLGHFALRGGVLNVDSLVCTNNLDSVFEFSYGTLRSHRLDLIPKDFLWQLGLTGNQTANWLVEGTNVIAGLWGVSYGSVALGCTPGARAIVTVNGPAARLEADGFFYLGWESVSPSELVITSGATANVLGLGFEGSYGEDSVGHSLRVLGNGSQLSMNLGASFYSSLSSLVISNGASSGGDEIEFFGKTNLVLVTGTNSLLTCNSIRLGGMGNEVIITNGAVLSAHEWVDVGASIPATGAVFRVLGAQAEMSGLKVGSVFQLDKGSVLTSSFITSDNAVVDFRSGVLTVLETALVESALPFEMGGSSSRAVWQMFGPSQIEVYSALILKTNAELVITGTVYTANVIVTNGPSDAIVFNHGQWTSAQTRIQTGSALFVGDGTNAATFRFDGGTHIFVDGLRVRKNSTMTGAGTIIGNITCDNESQWLCDLAGRISQPDQPLLVVTGNVSIAGTINLANTPPSNPIRYTLASHTGSLTTNGLTITGLPSGYVGQLDVNVPGQLAVIVKPASPLPPDYFGIVAAASNWSTLSFSATNSATYRVEYSNLLQPATWLPLVDRVGVPTLLSVVDTNASTPRRFYRLRIAPPP